MGSMSISETNRRIPMNHPVWRCFFFFVAQLLRFKWGKGLTLNFWSGCSIQIFNLSLLVSFLDLLSFLESFGSALAIAFLSVCVRSCASPILHKSFSLLGSLSCFVAPHSFWCEEDTFWLLFWLYLAVLQLRCHWRWYSKCHRRCVLPSSKSQLFLYRSS